MIQRKVEGFEYWGTFPLSSPLASVPICISVHMYCLLFTCTIYTTVHAAVHRSGLTFLQPWIKSANYPNPKSTTSTHRQIFQPAQSHCQHDYQGGHNSYILPKFFRARRIILASRRLLTPEYARSSCFLDANLCFLILLFV